MHALLKSTSTLASKPTMSAPKRMQPTYPALVKQPSTSLETPVDNHLTRADFQNFLSAIQVGRVARQQRIVKKLSDMHF
ncbi:hypothetical protein [Pseudomonas serbica]|uniref:hypothetical protein n=1 Tax=Pseudomonas serbica TaxID=2965074 RepID=UPI00237A5989|nr:hypothetical protein [Pseudomonas serbica]